MPFDLIRETGGLFAERRERISGEQRRSGWLGFRRDRCTRRRGTLATSDCHSSLAKTLLISDGLSSFLSSTFGHTDPSASAPLSNDPTSSSLRRRLICGSSVVNIYTFFSSSFPRDDSLECSASRRFSLRAKKILGRGDLCEINKLRSNTCFDEIAKFSIKKHVLLFASKQHLFSFFFTFFFRKKSNAMIFFSIVRRSVKN